MAFGRKMGKGQILATLSNFRFSSSVGHKTYTRHIIHANDGWVVIYDEEDPTSGYKEQRTCYIQAADGHVKWDQINKAQI